MQPNHHISNMVKATAVLDRGTGVPCSHNCSQSYSVARCVTCEKFLCRECLTDHNKYRGHSKHSVLSMEGLSKHENQLKIKRKMFCKQLGHEDRALKFYCETCDQLICRYCMDFKHHKQGHICHIAKEIAHKHRELVVASNDNVENLLEEGEAFLTQLSFVTKRVDMHAQDAKSEVAARKETILNKISDGLERKTKELMARIDEIQGDKLRKLKKHTDKTKAYVMTIQRCIQSSTKRLDEGTDEEIISSQKTLHDSEEKLVAERSKHFKVPVTDLNVHYSHFNVNEIQMADILGKAMASMGQIKEEVTSDQEIEVIEEIVDRNEVPLGQRIFVQSSSNRNKCLCAYYGDSKLIVYQGDITREKVDAIVMPITRQSYENVKDIMPVNFGDVVVRHEEDLPSKMVLYVIGFKEVEELEQQNCDVSLVRKIIFNSLVLASKHNTERISMSAIGPGLNGMSVEVCAETTFDVVEEFLKGSNESIQEIRFINEDKQTSLEFSNEMVRRYQASEICISDLMHECDNHIDNSYDNSYLEHRCWETCQARLFNT